MKNRVIVETYIKIADGFVDFFEFQGEVRHLDQIEGALVLSINGKRLIDQSMFDYVDDLWSYLSKGLLKVSEGQSFSCFFPDQPIEVKLTHANGRLQVSVNCHREVSVAADKDEFVRVMSEQARKFFIHLQNIQPGAQRTCSYALGHLDKICR